ncbi:hypothetical protein GCM10010468_35540 [Actinocorallia longicatena]|uniref:Uncharacterized protein n=1 Tax=Actinocorallia longicatena TaxID=111803 RepID=A0ABP6QDN0_9ACTN
MDGSELPEPRRHHMHGHSSEQQRGRVDMTEIVKPSVEERFGRRRSVGRVVVPFGQVTDEAGHRVGIDGITPARSEDVAVSC